MTAERPDPLAEPEGYGRKPGCGDGPDLSICSQNVAKDRNCGEPVSMVIWIGCTKGEHAGPLAFCEAHGKYAIRQAHFLVCGQCFDSMGVNEAGRARILKITTPDGCVMTVLPDDAIQERLGKIIGR